MKRLAKYLALNTAIVIMFRFIFDQDIEVSYIVSLALLLISINAIFLSTSNLKVLSDRYNIFLKYFCRLTGTLLIAIIGLIFFFPKLAAQQERYDINKFCRTSFHSLSCVYLIRSSDLPSKEYLSLCSKPLINLEKHFISTQDTKNQKLLRESVEHLKKDNIKDFKDKLRQIEQELLKSVK